MRAHVCAWRGLFELCLLIFSSAGQPIAHYCAKTCDVAACHANASTPTRTPTLLSPTAKAPTDSPTASPTTRPSASQTTSPAAPVPETLFISKIAELEGNGKYVELFNYGTKCVHRLANVIPVNCNDSSPWRDRARALWRAGAPHLAPLSTATPTRTQGRGVGPSLVNRKLYRWCVCSALHLVRAAAVLPVAQCVSEASEPYVHSGCDQGKWESRWPASSLPRSGTVRPRHQQRR